jgi:hypothetical protein
MYSDHLVTAELAAKSEFNLSRDPSLPIALNAFTIGPGELADAGFALPFNFSGAWVTSFSNLNLPAAVYWRLVSDPLAPRDFRDWVASLPPDPDGAMRTAADRVAGLTGDPAPDAFNRSAWAAEQIAEAAFSMPFAVSGTWVTSFRNASLPDRTYGESPPDPLSAPTTRSWIASRPFQKTAAFD